MDFLNNELMQQLVGKTLRKELDKLSEEAKASLGKMQVDVVRQPDRIVIAIDARGDADVEIARNIMLDTLLNPVSRIIALFGCQVNVDQSS